MTRLFWHCLRDPPAGLTRAAFGEAVAAGGLSAAMPVLRVLLRQVLDHLIGNAARFVGNGTIARISVGAQELPDGWWRIEVADRGIGIRPTMKTGNRLLDAYLWIKVPGESDGKCYRGTAGPQDPVRGMEDPDAGGWFPEQARELIQFASPPVASYSASTMNWGLISASDESS